MGGGIPLAASGHGQNQGQRLNLVGRVRLLMIDFGYRIHRFCRSGNFDSFGTRGDARLRQKYGGQNWER